MCERRGITADTALRLACFFDADAQSLLNLQMRYELLTAQDAIGDQLKQNRPRAA